MALRCVGVGRIRWQTLAGAVGVLASLATTTSAEARHAHHGRHGHLKSRPHVSRSGGYEPPYAAMVVDANSGRTMYAVNEDESRHPASVTKVMTLYLLFEQLERGTLSLNSELDVSARAASQAPSKLGLRPGDTIKVEDAIKAIVTKSANDVAVVIAENVGGSEPDFAEKMTRKARQLGMAGTVYRNASGLPNPEQITTAHDLTILARAIQDKFPRLYKYFGTRVFYYAGRPIPNHNHLLGRVEGVDGIKTGFTNASGFNLMTSARMEGRHVVGVVLGGRSAASRDNIMAGLIRTNLAKATVGRTTRVVDADMESPALAFQRKDVDENDAADEPGDAKPARPAARPVELVRPAVASAANAAATTTPSSTRGSTPKDMQLASGPSRRIEIRGAVAQRPCCVGHARAAGKARQLRARGNDRLHQDGRHPPEARGERQARIGHSLGDPARRRAGRASGARNSRRRQIALRSRSREGPALHREGGAWQLDAVAGAVLGVQRSGRRRGRLQVPQTQRVRVFRDPQLTVWCLSSPTKVGQPRRVWSISDVGSAERPSPG